MTTSANITALASGCGLSLDYRGAGGELTRPPHATFVALLRALGVLPAEDTPSEAELDRLLAQHREAAASAPLPACVIARAGEETHFTVHVHDGHPAHVWIRLEDGTSRDAYQDENWTPPTTVEEVSWGEATFHVPGDLPCGYHELTLESDNLTATCPLIVVPRALHTAEPFVHEPAYGVMAQLYSVRSANSWGVGDFSDLALLAETLAAEGADYLLINPVHAAEPVAPIEDSPYLPTSRRFVNPLYIAVEEVPEFALLDAPSRAEIDRLTAPLKAMNRSAAPIERTPIYCAKLAVLRELFTLSATDEKRCASFAEFVELEGDGLVDFGRWCAERAAEHEGRHAAQDPELARFYMWLQFVAEEQRRRAHERALAAGMRIGILNDLAVGVHPGGADAHTLADVLVADASVGAPPDQFTQQGQDWSQPPWHPQGLAAAGYAPWRELLRTVLRHSGGIRVDHILGLFRLFWIPRMDSPANGAYMNYDHEAMLGVLLLEAQRAGAVVVGEDLGTFEPWVQDVLRDAGILGTSVVWFESAPPGGHPLPQSHYRHLALTSLGTHDLPPTAGYLRGAHNELRVKLGLAATCLAELNANDAAWQAAVIEEAGADPDDPLIGLTRFVAGTPSALTCTQLVDMVGDRRIQNQPGTNATQYPNWRMPLCDGQGRPVLIEDLPGNDLFRRVAAASRRG